MEVSLHEVPQRSNIICGFPGFGLIGSIVTEYLLEHLNTRQIGVFSSKNLPPMMAIHGGKLVDPIAIHYAEEYNIVLIHAITPLQGLEWEITEAITKLSQQINPYRVYFVEGVMDPTNKQDSTVLKFSLSDSQDVPCEELQEGILMGVSATLATKKDIPLSILFASSHSQLPDSKAASSVISVLDACLGLRVDPEPLAQKASEFEDKLQSILTSQKTVEDKQKLNYVG